MPLFSFDNTYATLPERFFTKTPPTPVSAPRLIKLNTQLATDLGLDVEALSSPNGLEVLAGNRVPDNTIAIATAYAGHQFGGFVPQLGDGRAILLGEVVDRNGIRRDIQLKGAGRTPFSRGGDGRAALGPVLREYIMSEAMFALGIPTTRALAAVTTGDKVFREDMQPGAILTRVASSHIRIGTFQFFASRRDVEAVKLLADHVIARHYPHAASAPQPYRALLDAVIKAQAELIPQWLCIGFIHGVMNTDNMSVAGETIDYGPCAFMDEYNPDQVFSSIDHHGRYAYSMQPAVAEWNLTRLAECLVPLLHENAETAIEYAREALLTFMPQFDNAYEAGLRRKMGLYTEREEDLSLANDLLTEMAATGADFTLTFRYLTEASAGLEHAPKLRTLFNDSATLGEWLLRWRARLRQEDTKKDVRLKKMRKTNPAFIPRNHRVEAVIRAAVDRNDFAPFEELHAVLSRPFEDQPGFEHYMQPPQEGERVFKTFCGT